MIVSRLALARQRHEKRINFVLRNLRLRESGGAVPGLLLLGFGRGNFGHVVVCGELQVDGVGAAESQVGDRS